MTTYFSKITFTTDYQEGDLIGITQDIISETWDALFDNDDVENELDGDAMSDWITEEKLREMVSIAGNTITIAWYDYITPQVYSQDLHTITASYSNQSITKGMTGESRGTEITSSQPIWMTKDGEIHWKEPQLTA